MEQRRDGGISDQGARSFPGGKVRLPRLNEDRSQGPLIDMVDTAFIGGGTAATSEPQTPSGFNGYYTYESLFEAPPENETERPIEDHYAVLRVEPGADWAAIVAAHRTLVKQFHPDRFVDHPAAVVAEAEVEIKRINRAYSELRRARAASADRRTGKDRRSSPR